MASLMFFTSGILRESVSKTKSKTGVLPLRFRGTDVQNKKTSWTLYANTDQCLLFNRGQMSNINMDLTLEIELVAAISGFRNRTLVDISLPVSAETAPRSTDQEPAENSMPSSRKQLQAERDRRGQNR